MHAGDSAAEFVAGDVITLQGIDEHYDVSIFSHVIEMLSSPQEALANARRVADVIAIRFFEPPEHEADVVELCELDAGDGRVVPYTDASFDAVICTQVLEHSVDPDALLREMWRVLRPGGRLLITVPFMWGLHETPFDFRRYSSFGLPRAVEAAGFRVLQI